MAEFKYIKKEAAKAPNGLVVAIIIWLAIAVGGSAVGLVTRLHSRAACIDHPASMECADMNGSRY
jgi:hypothetical protein